MDDAVAEITEESLGTYLYSVTSLSEDGLRPLTYQDALVLISSSVELSDECEGKLFWLAGEGLSASRYHTFDKSGELSGLERVEVGRD